MGERDGVPEEMKKVATVKRRRPTTRPTRGMAVVTGRVKVGKVRHAPQYARI
jgi:hypothetical protein